MNCLKIHVYRWIGVLDKNVSDISNNFLSLNCFKIHVYKGKGVLSGTPPFGYTYIDT